MAAAVSTIYAPLGLMGDNDSTPHRRNISNSTASTADSADSAEALISNPNPSLNSVSPIDLHWSSDFVNKTKEKIIEREIRDETNSTPSSSLKYLNGGSWRLEVISLIASVLSIATIIGVLFHFDGQALPDWPNGISLNTLIALLTAIANATLAAPLSSGLSQIKWIHFKQERRPLTDMELFDDASRGVYGAMKLLIFARGG